MNSASASCRDIRGDRNAANAGIIVDEDDLILGEIEEFRGHGRALPGGLEQDSRFPT